MQPKVLIVDDEEVFANTLAERLSIRDYKASVAYNGKDAVAHVQKNKPDVVILDVSMPGMDGIEALKEIKKARPLTEVIMLTGHATVETAIDGMKLGAMDYLMKPCDTEDLTEKINMAYKHKAEHEERILQAKLQRIISSPRSVFKEED
jgi:DNA-binding NtrC family response regulator